PGAEVAGDQGQEGAGEGVPHAQHGEDHTVGAGRSTTLNWSVWAAWLMDVELQLVEKRQAASLSRWVDAYFAEVANFRELAVGPTSAADYRYLPLYWTEPARRPFFVRAEGAVVGFALVRHVAQPDPFSELAEFFIQRTSRRAGIGRRAARAAWEMFP